MTALKGGRVLVVEYKGDLWTDTADTRERAMIGIIWEARSKGRCIFRVVGKSDFEAQITAAIRK